MGRPAGGRSTSLFPISGRPAIIAHGAGNSKNGLQAAFEAKADFVEVDLWVHGDQFESRHERRVVKVPLLFDSWALRRPSRDPLSFVELLDACRGRAGILLDLKNRSDEAVDLVQSSLARVGRYPKGTLLASSQSWPLLRSLSSACPEIGVLYSVDVRSQSMLFRSVIEDDPIPSGVSCRAALLSQASVRHFHERGIAVAAWTVDDGDRAEELASWGVDAITTTIPAVIRNRFGD